MTRPLPASVASPTTLHIDLGTGLVGAVSGVFPPKSSASLERIPSALVQVNDQFAFTRCLGTATTRTS